MKPLHNLCLIFLLLPMLYWGCEDDLCTRVDCAGDDVMLFSILNMDNGLDLVYEENLIDPETDINLYYKLADEKVTVNISSHFGKIRFVPHYTTGENRYFIDVLDQIDTLDFYYTLGHHAVNPHYCCSTPTHEIDSIYVNHIRFIPEFSSNITSLLVIYR